MRERKRQPARLGNRPAWLTTPAQAAYALHREIQTSWEAMTVRPEVVPFIGWNHPTLDAAHWETGRLIVGKQRRDWIAPDGWEHDFGDGTVPAFSALPLELSGHTEIIVRREQKHLRMATLPDVPRVIARLLGRLAPSEAEGPANGGRKPALGVDLAEVQPADIPIPISVVAREIAPDLAGQPLLARIRPHMSAEQPGPWGPRVELGWDAATGRFRGELPPAAPGLWDVHVRAREVPGAGTLEALDTIAVTAR